MTPTQADELARYARAQCDWLAIRVVDGTVVLTLAWPRGQRRVVHAYRRSAVLAAIDELVAISEGYWASAEPRRAPRARTHVRDAS